MLNGRAATIHIHHHLPPVCELRVDFYPARAGLYPNLASLVSGRQSWARLPVAVSPADKWHVLCFIGSTIQRSSRSCEGPHMSSQTRLHALGPLATSESCLCLAHSPLGPSRTSPCPSSILYPLQLLSRGCKIGEICAAFHVLHESFIVVTVFEDEKYWGLCIQGDYKVFNKHSMD